MWPCWAVYERSGACIMMGRWEEAETAVSVWCHSGKTPGGAAAGLQNKAALVSWQQHVSQDTMKACLQIKSAGRLRNTDTSEYLHWAGRFQVEEVGLGANRIQEMGLDLKRLNHKTPTQNTGHNITFVQNEVMVQWSDICQQCLGLKVVFNLTYSDSPWPVKVCHWNHKCPCLTEKWLLSEIICETLCLHLKETWIHHFILDQVFNWRSCVWDW